MEQFVTPPTIDRQVERRLAEAAVRYTKGRRVVVGALAQADGPRSAAELHAEIGNAIPLSSLYRSLAVLEEAGVIAPHFSSPGLTRYELAEWLSGHHHHLVCIECGQVQDLAASESIEERLQAIVADVAREASFAEVNHALEIEGRCARCA
ncbi:MAG: transcriptional repressor [Acidimicrobiia bacterium]|nr:transcriptional repressor [Acidimicrobiia bacterium]